MSYHANKRWKLVNYTKFSNEIIRRIVAYAKPSGLSGFTVKIHNSQWGWHGRAYCGAKLIKIYAPKGITATTRYKRPEVHDHTARKRGYVKSVQFSPIESMIHLIAHELRHLWQPTHRTRRMPTARHGRISERDADIYAIRKVRAYRKS